MNRLIRNFSYAFIAQGISYTLSIITGFIVPKMLGVEEYGYWQLFVFYGSYMNFCMLGAHDGMYLRLGGEEYNSLNFQREGSQFKKLMSFEGIIGVIIIILAPFLTHEASRYFVLVNLAFYLVLINASQYLGELFQSVNETPIFSKATMINKISYMITVIVLLLFKVYDFRPYIIAMNICTAFSVVYYMVKGKELFKRYGTLSIKETLWNVLKDIKSGWKIMIGGYAAMLIVGAGRGIIDSKWGISTFGKLSISISLINMIMQFINQIGIVLFPALRTVNGEEQKKLYQNMRAVLFVILPVAYILYYPLAVFIKLWLPTYEESVVYLAVLLPMCVFDTKTNMLSLTYMKVLRKERTILIVNLFSLGLNFILIFLGLWAKSNVFVVLLAMVISGTVRSILFDFEMMKVFHTCNIYEEVIEVLLMASFISANILITQYSIIVMVIEYIAFVAIIKRENFSFFKSLVKAIKRK